MLSIYDRMVNRIKGQFPAAHNIGKAYIHNGNIEVQFFPFTNCLSCYTLVYYGDNKYEIIRDWSENDSCNGTDMQSMELENELRFHGGQELGFIPGTKHL